MYFGIENFPILTTELGYMVGPRLRELVPCEPGDEIHAT